MSQTEMHKQRDKFKAHKVGYTTMRCGCGWSGAHTHWAEHKQASHGFQPKRMSRWERLQAKRRPHVERTKVVQ